MGYFLVYITTFFDLTTPLLVLLLFVLGQRAERKNQLLTSQDNANSVESSKKTN